MSDERIDIEVTDKVDGNVENKLRGIAAAADKGESSISKLKAALAAINTGPVQQLQEAARTVTSTINNELSAVSRLRNEVEKGATSDLKAALAKEKMAAAADRAAAAAARAATATARMDAATAAALLGEQRLNTELVKTAIAEERLAEQKSKTALAALRLAEAEDRAAAAKAKSAAASAAAAIQAEKEAAATDHISAALDRLEARQAARKVPPRPSQQLAAPVAGSGGYDVSAVNLGNASREASAAIEQLSSVSQSRFAKIKAAAVNAFDTTRDAIAHMATGFRTSASTIVTSTNQINQAAETQLRQGQKTKFQNANIIAQLQDIGVSLAGGQNPLLVMIQQGSQLSYIATTMDGGLKALLATIARMLIPFAGLAAIVSGLYLGFKLFTNDIAAKHKPELENYAKSLGLTSKEMRKLGDDTVGANGKLKSFDTVTITMGDSWKGFIKTVGEGLSWIGDYWTQFTEQYGTTWDKVTKFAGEVFIASLGIIIGGVKSLGLYVFDSIPKYFANGFTAAANAGLEAVEWLVNKSITALNKVGSWINAAAEKAGLGKVFDEVADVTLPRFVSKAQGHVKGFKELLSEEIPKAAKIADKNLRAFGDRWEQNSVDAAKKRLKTAADAIMDNRDPKKAKKEADPKTQSDYLDDENKKLDNQLSRMKMLKDAREEQQQLDQIQEQFAKRRMPLDAAQLEAFRGRIRAIQEYKYQQAEMDRIYESATAPLRTYNASIAAATDLLARAAITQDQFNQEMTRANRAYKEASDPLFAMKEAIEQNERASGLYGDALQRNNYYEQIRAAYLAKNIDITNTSSEAIRKEVAALMARNDALMQKQYIESQVGQVINPILEDAKFLENKEAFYSEIDRLRQNDVLSEEQAQMAKQAIQAKYDEIRLRGITSLLDNVAALSKSKNKELAAIGKAAAIAQATIDGYLAVQKALSSAPPPLNFISAGVVGVTAALNVAKIAGVGFEKGGYTGNGGRKEIAGVVHGREYVMDAASTARIGVARLDAMRSGLPGYEQGGYVDPLPPSGHSNGGGKTNIVVNNYSGEAAEVKETKREDGGVDIEVIIGQLEKRMAVRTQQGGTPLNRAMERRYGLNAAKGNAQ